MTRPGAGRGVDELAEVAQCKGVIRSLREHALRVRAAADDPARVGLAANDAPLLAEQLRLLATATSAAIQEVLYYNTFGNLVIQNNAFSERTER